MSSPKMGRLCDTCATDSIASTTFGEAQRRGNVLNYFPSELRNEIYGSVLAEHEGGIMTFNEHCKPSVAPLPLMQSCKQMYREVEPHFLGSLKFVVQDSNDLLVVEGWLLRKSLDAFHYVRAIVFTSIKPLRKVSEGLHTQWWNTTSEIKRQAIQSRAYIPTATPFLQCCSGLAHVEINIEDAFPQENAEVCASDGILAAAVELYDLEAILRIPRLYTLIVHLGVGKIYEPGDCASVMWFSNDRIAYGHNEAASKFRDCWGLISWFRGQLLSQEENVRLQHCHHLNSDYPYQSLTFDELSSAIKTYGLW